MSTLHLVMVVGPLGVSKAWPARLYFYARLPQDVANWNELLFRRTKGEGRAYHFALQDSDLAFPEDIEALYGQQLEALEPPETPEHQPPLKKVN